MPKTKCGIVLSAVLTLAFPSLGLCQAGRIPGREEAEALLMEKGGISISLPDLGYTWEEEAATGTAESGSIRVTHEKMLYFFVHWGPMEVEEITEAYVRERVPKVWPTERLQVVSTRPVTVAGHPAVYAEVQPSRGFYSAHFIIWNCPETNRQFIADMNYNTDLRTPRIELDAQVDAVTQTLVCHEGAPASSVDTHVVEYDSPRFGIRFFHPLHWYVFENPYGVPHPAYRGIRDRTVGSVLAWPQDMPVGLTFVWEPKDETEEEGAMGMVGNVRSYQKAVEVASKLDGVESFSPQASETVTVSGQRVMKVLGRVVKEPGETAGEDAAANASLMVLVLEDYPGDRDLFITISVDDYSLEGVFHPPVRDIFDRWAVALVEGLAGKEG